MESSIANCLISHCSDMWYHPITVFTQDFAASKEEKATYQFQILEQALGLSNSARATRTEPTRIGMRAYTSQVSKFLHASRGKSRQPQTNPCKKAWGSCLRAAWVSIREGGDPGPQAHYHGRACLATAAILFFFASGRRR